MEKTLKLALIIFLTILSASLSAEEKITREEYDSRMQVARQKNEESLPRIAKLKAQILDVKDEIESLNGDSRKVWREILNLAGANQSQYDEFVTSLESTLSDIQKLESSQGSNLGEWRQEIARFHTKIIEYKSSPMAAIPRVERMFSDMEGALSISQTALDQSQAKSSEQTAALHSKPEVEVETERMNAAENKATPDFEYQNDRKVETSSGGDSYAGSYTAPGESYIVNPGNSLWRIARMPQNGGNPFRWQEIYRANQDKITDPNVIFPGMVLDIPR